MPTIFHRVLIRADRAKIYDAITTKEGLSKWWIADCIAKPEIGFINESKVGKHVHNKMKVIDLKPGTSVEWECLNEKDAWTGTHVTFELSEKGDFSCMDFKHKGYKNQDGFFATCNYHWGRHLTMLKNFCETGKAQVDKKKEIKEVKAVRHGKA